MTSYKSAPNDVRNEAGNAPQTIKSDLREGIQSLGAEVTSIAKKAGKEAREYVDATGQYITEAREQFDGVKEKLTSHINENPVRSSLLALGAGFLLASILRRR